MSRFVDATLVVVDSRSTARKSVRRTLQLLGQVNAPVLGVIFNGAPVGGAYGYGYTYGSDHQSRRQRKRTERADIAAPR